MARAGYDNDAYELWRDETAPVGCAEQFTASSAPPLPRARVPLANSRITRRNRQCAAALVAVSHVRQAFWASIQRLIALWKQLLRSDLSN